MSTPNNTVSNSDSNIPTRLKGKVAIVTGAGTGIGAATAIRLAQEGANVVLVGRRAERLNEVAERIKQLNNGSKTLVFPGDVGDEELNQKVVEQAVATFGGLHIAFNNAGIYRGNKPIWETETKTYREVFRTNVDSIFLALKYQIPAISKSGGGSIINDSSVVGLRAISFAPGGSTYVASKFAVTGITQAAAIDAAPLNVRVNAVAPGVVTSEIMDADMSEQDAEKLRQLFATNLNLIKRPGTGEEIAAAVAFLASDEARFITGTSLTVDGGGFLH